MPEEEASFTSAAAAAVEKTFANGSRRRGEPPSPSLLPLSFSLQLQKAQAAPLIIFTHEVARERNISRERQVNRYNDIS